MRFSCIQLISGESIQDNLLRAEALIRKASDQGAQVVCTPEVTDQMLENRSDRVVECFTQHEHPAVSFFSNLAQELSLYLLIGSIVIKSDETSALYNRSFLFDPEGRIQAIYDKMHLCDTELPTGEKYQESSCFHHGNRAVISEIKQDVVLGMSICRDLRYPQMYRALARQGATVMSIPSAWLATTGVLHWEVLLRARAIETGCFIIAPNQVGGQTGNRKNYGNSMIINPWGEIIAHTQNEGEDVIVADLDLSLVAQARKAIPCFSHNPDYVF